MKLLVFSDSHTDVEAMLAVAVREAPDTIIHLGDHIYDAIALRECLANVPFIMVRGNTDSGNHLEEATFTFFGKRFFLTHGHRFRVKHGLSELQRKGDQDGIDLILFGHTHKPLIQPSGAVTLMNPGAASQTYGLVYADETGFRCEIAQVAPQPAIHKTRREHPL